MTAHEILEAWFRYTDFDPEQTHFHLGSINYAAHRINKQLISMLAYDPTGTISVICAKDCFLNICKEIRLPLLDVLAHPDELDRERELYRMFTGKDVEQAETALLDNVDTIVRNVIPVAMIGERDIEKEKEVLLSSISDVTTELQTCQKELYCRGASKLGPITRFGTKILPFHTLAECIVSMASAPDGIYLCYIDCHESINGWFGFFIKQGTTLLSVNDRVNEAFPGQHANSRNNRWIENKKYGLFPYTTVCNFDGSDYLGYATGQTIDNDKLELFRLGDAAYMPIILAMVLLANVMNGQDVSDMPLTYTANLLPINRQKLPENHALSVITDKALAATYQNLDIRYSTEEILEGNTAAHPEKYPPMVQQIPGNDCESAALFVRLYGDGFELDNSDLLNNHRALLPGRTPTELSEIIGTEDKLKAIAYMQARQQLAFHIREKQYEQFLADNLDEDTGSRFFSKTDHIYLDAATANLKYLYQLCVQKYNAVQNNEEKNVHSKGWIDASGHPLAFISFETGKEPNEYATLNKRGVGPKRNTVICPFTGNRATMFFYFRPTTWEQLEMICGKDTLPKSLKGWTRTGHIGCGNSLLEITDPLSEIGTVFEDREHSRNLRTWTDWTADHHNFMNSDDPVTLPENHLQHTPYFHPDFFIGFSKRGFAQLRHNIEINSPDNTESTS
jgi:hypothetical protein